MRQLLAHGHIFKNAGTTLDWSLQRSFGDGFLDHREDQRMREEGASLVLELLEQQPELKALSSHHLCWPLPASAEISISPVFMLRHPLARLQSVYQFEKRQEADTPGANKASQVGFRDYTAWRMQEDVGRTVRNYQVSYLGGVRRSVRDRRINHQIMSLAMQTVTEQLVGVVERYDESMVVFEYDLAEAFPGLDLSYLPQNQTQSLSEQSPDTVIANTLAELGDLQQEVLDKNALDMALYQLARQRLQERINGIADFKERLKAFRARCRELK